MHILTHAYTYLHIRIRINTCVYVYSTYIYIYIHCIFWKDLMQVIRLSGWFSTIPWWCHGGEKKHHWSHSRCWKFAKKCMVSCPTDLDTPKWLMGGVSSNISELSTSPSLVVFFLIVNLFGSCRCNQTCHGNRLQKCWNPRKTFPSQVVGDVSPTIRNTKIPQAKRWLQHIFQAAVKHFTSVPFQVTL